MRRVSKQTRFILIGCIAVVLFLLWRSGKPRTTSRVPVMQDHKYFKELQREVETHGRKKEKHLVKDEVPNVAVKTTQLTHDGDIKTTDNITPHILQQVKHEKDSYSSVQIKGYASTTERSQSAATLKTADIVSKSKGSNGFGLTKTKTSLTTSGPTSPMIKNETAENQKQKVQRIRSNQTLRTNTKTSSSHSSKQPLQQDQGNGQIKSATACDRHCLKVENIMKNKTFETLHATGNNTLANYFYDRPNKTKKNDSLDVVFMPFSHLDPGWGMTIDGYYSNFVQYIFNIVFSSLKDHPEERFIVAEMIYLKRWYDEVSNEWKEMLRKLVQNGQVEIVTGGWVMPDEAITHYQAVVDQMIHGHLWVKETFNVTPRYGFANDPFGHSPTFAYLAQKAGIKGMFIHRIHQYVKRWFAERGKQDFTWRQSWDTSHKHDIPVHLMAMHDYDLNSQCNTVPDGCHKFDFTKIDAAIQPDSSNEAEIGKLCDELATGYRKLSTLYPTDVLLIILGRDFVFRGQDDIRATDWAKAMTSYGVLHDYINANPNKYQMKIKKGTLQDYFKAVEKRVSASNTKLLPVSGDFFTYSDRAATYWSGFYTSRPFSKYMARRLQRSIFAADFLLARVVTSQPEVNSSTLHSLFKDLDLARGELGSFQHHDAITGTSNQPVTSDFLGRLTEAEDATEEIISKLPELMILDSKKVQNDNKIIFHLNLDSIEGNVTLSERSQFTVSGFNPSGYTRSELVTVRVDKPCWSAGENVQLQINPIISNWGDFDEKYYQLLILLHVKPFEFKKITLQKCNCADVSGTIASITVAGERIIVPGLFHKTSRVVDQAREFTAEGHRVNVTFNTNQGFLVISRPGVPDTTIQLQPIQYTVENGGPYIFDPRKARSEGLREPSASLVRIIRGPLQTIVHNVAPIQHRTLSLCHFESSQCSSLKFEVRTNIKNLGFNVEVGLDVTTSIENKRVLYTDLNGFQMSRREYNKNIPLEGNFYPFTSIAYIQDQKARLSILSREPHGIASVEKGQMQIILDRVLSQDDFKGIGQGIWDNLPVTNTFIILLEPTPNSEIASPRVSYPTLLSTVTNEIFQTRFLSWLTAENLEVIVPQPVKQHLPCPLSVVGFRHAGQDKQRNTLVHRFILTVRRHVFSSSSTSDIPGATCTVSQEDITISYLLPDAKIIALKHTSLTGIEYLTDLNIQSKLTVDPHEIESFLVVIEGRSA